MRFLKDVFKEFADDECPRMAAALSYYTVFALPPLLVLTILLLGTVVDTAAAQERITQQARELAGPDAAGQIRTMLANASAPGAGNPLTVALGFAGLLFGATGAFAQLQATLNRAWNVEEGGRGGVSGFIAKRALSFAMILTVAFLLLVSLLVSAALAAFGDTLAEVLPGTVSRPLLQVVDLGITLLTVALLVAAIYKVLPDIEIGWAQVGLGAVVTAVLFTAGKFLIGFYLGRSDPGSAYGAAGSLAVLLVWVYYNALIFFLGAEFTQVWARRRGDRLRAARSST